ncbi:MAG: formylglycine-generating enzyme family protein [bacterium]|nr:formylglycine-generating enzyme family protein [bacterium]
MVEKSVTIDDNTIIRIVYIPGGTFIMGSHEVIVSESACSIPEHEVDVLPFWIGKYPITEGQFFAVTGFASPGIYDADVFARSISWKMAIHFCRKLTERLKRTVRLPSEAEWEYACGDHWDYIDGSSYLSIEEYAWCDCGPFNDAPNRNVGRFKPNVFGLYDMLGGVKMVLKQHVYYVGVRSVRLRRVYTALLGFIVWKVPPAMILVLGL